MITPFNFDPHSRCGTGNKASPKRYISLSGKWPANFEKTSTCRAAHKEKREESVCLTSKRPRTSSQMEYTGE